MEKKNKSDFQRWCFRRKLDVLYYWSGLQLAVGCIVCCVGRTFLAIHNRDCFRQTLIGCLFRVNADHPCRKLCKLCTVGVCRVGIRVSGFKVVEPVCTGVVGTLPKNTVTGVVQDFPGLVPVLVNLFGNILFEKIC